MLISPAQDLPVSCTILQVCFKFTIAETYQAAESRENTRIYYERRQFKFERKGSRDNSGVGGAVVGKKIVKGKTELALQSESNTVKC